jgi:hypothetical protein
MDGEHMHIRIYIHIYAHTHTHTYIFIYIHIYKQFPKAASAAYQTLRAMGVVDESGTCVCGGERERKKMCMCVCVWEREREKMCMCV